MIISIILLTVSSNVISACLGLFSIQDQFSEDYYISSTLCSLAGKDADIRYWYRDRVVTGQCKQTVPQYEVVEAKSGREIKRISDFLVHPSVWFANLIRNTIENFSR